MKPLLLGCAVLALAGCVAMPIPGMGGGMSGTMQDAVAQRQAQSAEMQANMAMSQASANRPGDEAMTCDQLQVEMTALFQDPKFRASIDAMGAQAQAQLARQQQAQAGALATGIGAGIAGAAASVIPGMGWLSGGFAAAQMASVDSQVKQASRESSAMLTNMNDAIPQMMRGERLHTLASGKKCAFLSPRAPS